MHIVYIGATTDAPKFLEIKYIFCKYSTINSRKVMQDVHKNEKLEITCSEAALYKNFYDLQKM